MLTETLEMASAVGTTSRRSVLIVDDDEAMSDILSTRLSRQGFGTLVANSGRLALELAQSKMPDCILLDLRLPDIDGFELCQQLVDAEATSEIPVIIVSGLERPDIIRRSRAAGCHYYVRKPYDPNALLALIHQAIDGARSDE
jgi:twitching motility two-component system response regulator PilH